VLIHLFFASEYLRLALRAWRIVSHRRGARFGARLVAVAA
jgi:hypothetical protein